MTTTPDTLKAEIKQAIVRSLRLPITVEEIGDDTPLFGEGLGLDSIDVLELVLELERSFGVSIGDEQTGMRGPAIGRHDRRLHPQAAGGRLRLSRPSITHGRRQLSAERLHGRSRGVVSRLRRRRAAGARALGPPAVAGRADHAIACSICSTRADVRATFFVVGWVAERLSAAGRARARAPATKSARTATAHQRAYDLGPERFLQDLRASVARAGRRRRHRRSLFRAPEWSINERSLWALDVLAEEGFLSTPAWRR